MDAAPGLKTVRTEVRSRADLVAAAVAELDRGADVDQLKHQWADDGVPVDLATRALSEAADHRRYRREVQIGGKIIFLGAVITVVTYMLAPGGYYVLAFGPIVYGFYRMVTVPKPRSRTM